MQDIKKVFISGAGGIGISAIAKYFLRHGVSVCGSDLVRNESTMELETMGAQIFYTQSANNISADIDLFVYSPAVPELQAERVRAAELGIEQISYPQMLGLLSLRHDTIAISGTNGKSTTTAMIGSILTDAEVNPLVIIGSKLPKFKGNFRYGGGPFVVEACEYRGHMLNLSPKAIVLTNIEEDHLDYFRDINHILEIFQEYVDKLKQPEAILVINADDPNTAKLNLPACKIITYGLKAGQYQARNIVVGCGKQSFDVYESETCIGKVELLMPGEFNIYNALAATALARSYSVEFSVIQKALAEFSGLWRRFEKISDDKIVVISDYAHHPTSVAGTLKAAKAFYSGRRVVAIFQPHQHNRTKNLFSDFVKSFEAADVIILPEIFDVAGREEAPDQNVSSQDIVNELMKLYPDKIIRFAPDLAQAKIIVSELVTDGDVVVVMGAGDVYQLATIDLA